MTIQYIAGFFDGEGSIIIQGKKVSISIPQTNEEILLQIRDHFSVGQVYKVKKRQDHWKDAWVFRCTGSHKCLKILLELLPHLILKQEKAVDAIEVLSQLQNEKQIRVSRNEEAVKLVIQDGLSYRMVELRTGVSRQTLCNEIKKIRSIGEKVS